jgi:phosphoglycerate-specific signal transduction histidine kinase
MENAQRILAQAGSELEKARDELQKAREKLTFFETEPQVPSFFGGNQNQYFTFLTQQVKDRAAELKDREAALKDRAAELKDREAALIELTKLETQRAKPPSTAKKELAQDQAKVAN